MNSSKILFPAFLLIAVIQLIVPAKMILDQEGVLSAGKEYKFKTIPVDPSDPFRGKYITLQFEANTAPVDPAEVWTPGEVVFVLLTTDEAGFAQVRAVSKEMPLEGDADFLQAKVGRFASGDSGRLTIEYPFTRFYMEEFKAGPAEEAFRKSMSDPDKVTYALVQVKRGKGVLKDVLIDGVSLREVTDEAGE